jgi:hypothetical protein
LKIKILGWYNKDNIGDESYKLSFPMLFPYHHLTFSDKIDQYNADYYILGGGNIVNESFIEQLKDVKNKVAISVNVNQHNVHMLKDFKYVYVRDRVGYELLKQNNIPCDFGADISCILDAETKNFSQIYKKNNLELYENKAII